MFVFIFNQNLTFLFFKPTHYLYHRMLERYNK